MKEMQVEPGDSLPDACKRLTEMAPAFMVFNGTPVEAKPGDSPDVIRARWTVTRARQQGATERHTVGEEGT